MPDATKIPADQASGPPASERSVVAEQFKGPAMILESAVLEVKSGLEMEFEAAFEQAQDIISGMAGYISHQLQRCIEHPSRYLLLVNWANLEDHTVGFRESDEYKEWCRLLHHFYDPFPEVEHYQRVFNHPV